MKWIYQLGDGNMLALERGRVYRINTGYPYPDTDEPQFDLLYNLVSASGKYSTEEDLKRNLKDLVSQFNKFFDANSNEGLLSDMLYYSDDKYMLLASSDYCDFYLCKYDSFLDSLDKNDLIDTELSSYSVSDDMLLLIVPYSLRDKCELKCDWKGAVGEPQEDYDALFFNNFWSFNEFYTDLDKFVIYDRKKITGLVSLYDSFKNKVDFRFMIPKVKKYIEKYHKNEFSFKLISDMMKLSKHYDLFRKCYLNYMFNATFSDFNNMYDDVLVTLFHDIEKHRLMSLLNYNLSSNNILNYIRNGTKLKNGLVQIDLAEGNIIDTKRVYNIRCTLLSEPLNKIPMYILNQVVDFNDKGVIINAKGLYGEYLDFILVSKNTHKINCNMFKKYLSMLGLNISDAKISKGKLLEQKFLFNNKFISSNLNRDYSHLAFLYKECSTWSNFSISTSYLTLRNPFVLSWYDSVFNSIMPLEDFLNLNKDNFKYFIAFALAQNGMILKDAKIIVERLSIIENNLNIYYHLG